MARAEAAHASARPDSIQGLAQSIAKPAYRRLLVAEPALRRAVPCLIVAFLLTVGVGAIVQVHDRYRQVIQAATADIEMIADIVADRLNLGADATGSGLSGGVLDGALPDRAMTPGRHVLLFDTAGAVTAAIPSPPPNGLVDALGQARTQPGWRGSGDITTADGTAFLITVRSLELLGEVVVIHSRAAALAAWRSDTVLTVTLFATTGVVLLILGFAFHWQAMRAREADVLYDTVRGRIDTALNRGRCGLWDWDLARGRIFWSHSMFAILGLEPKNELMTFGEVSRLAHEDDIKLYELAAQLADARTNSIDCEFRMRHARGDWVWLRARCELVHQRDEPGVHVIGIAVEITEHKMLAEKTAAADMRL
ncbi:MAG TPA: PAS domain-containing protein, partial [Xanthobacteraceae bacterium]|nr:PAS domain-containing protein [Xanthobacteraceae bacterium]